MKTKHLFGLIVLGMLFCGLSWAGNVPGGDTAPDSISMPWKQFYEIWESSQVPMDNRSQPFGYKSASYTGHATIEKNNYYIRFDADIQITSFSEYKILVPVLSSELSPEAMTLNKKATGWIEKNGYYHVLIPQKGSYEIKAQFTITLDAKRWPRKFSLPLVPIPKSRIDLHVADTDTETRFEPGVVMETIQNEGGDHVKGIVPAVSIVGMRWLKRSERHEMIPLKMGAIIYSYASLGENGANLTSKVVFQILQGQTHFFRIRVPKSVDILDVTSMDGGQKISQWYAEDDEDGRMIHIYASYRQDEQFAVRLDCERTEIRSNYTFEMPHIIPQEVERYENLIATGSRVNVEITEKKVARAEGRDVRFLPEEIRSFAHGRALFYYKMLEENFDLQFEVKSHDKASVVKTRIQRVEADSVVTAAGMVMTKATFRVKNNQAQFLRLKPPTSSKLLSAFTNGREVQPVFDEDVLLVPLDKSTDKAFPVEIAWLSEIERFGAIGNVSVFLPHSDLSIGELAWRLYTPEEYQVVYLGGNVEFKSPGLTRYVGLLLSTVFEGTAGNAYAGYSSKSYEYNAEGLKKRFKTGRNFASNFDVQTMQSNQVQVQIPVTGDRYRFGSYLVKGFTPCIHFHYFNSTVHKIVTAIYSLAWFVFLFAFIAFVLERNEIPSLLRNRFVALIAAVAVLLLFIPSVIFKFGIIREISEATVFAFIIFALWQNRLVITRCRKISSERKYWLMKAAFCFLIFLIVAALLDGSSLAWAFLLSGIIFFHIVYYYFQKYRLNKRNKKTVETVAVIFFCFTLLMSAQEALAGASGNSTMGDDTINTTDASTRVNIIWPRLEKMLLKIEAQKELSKRALKTGYLFGTVNIDGDITEKYASLRLDVPLTLTNDRFIKIPLVSADTPLAEAFYNKTPLHLVRSGGFLCFEAGKTMAREGLLQLHLIAPVRETGGVKEFEVNSPLLQGGALELRFGTDIKSVKLYNVSWEKRDGRVIKAALGSSRQLRGELATFVRKQESADESDKRVKKRYATTYTLVSLEDEIATFYSSIRYRILNEHVRDFRIKLPESAVVHEIVGEDVERWKVEKVEKGIATYHIKVMYPVADRYDLSVRYEAAIAEKDQTFSIPSLLVEGVARDTGYIGVEMRGRGEIAVAGLEKARLIDIRELPRIIRTDADGTFVYAVRYIERPYLITFRIKKHKGLQMDPAIADRIEYTYIVSPRGKVLSQARIWMRNSRKQYISFHLPDNANLVSSFQDGKSIKPSIDESGILLLPLKRQSVTPFVMDVVFESADVSIGLIGGRVKLHYPRLDVPASTVSSNIYLPRRLKAFEPDGDFQKTKSINFVPWTSSIEGSDDMPSNNFYDQNQPALYQQLETAQSVAQTGTQSLKIAIPKHGRRIAMNAFYVPAGEKLETRILTIPQILYQTGYSLIICLLMGLGFSAVKYFRMPVYWVVVISLVTVGHQLFTLPWKTLLLCMLIGGGIYRILDWNKNRL